MPCSSRGPVAAEHEAAYQAALAKAAGSPAKRTTKKTEPEDPSTRFRCACGHVTARSGAKYASTAMEEHLDEAHGGSGRYEFVLD